jgi:hypothetical protein
MKHHTGTGFDILNPENRFVAASGLKGSRFGTEIAAALIVVRRVIEVMTCSPESLP